MFRRTLIAVIAVAIVLAAAATTWVVVNRGNGRAMALRAGAPGLGDPYFPEAGNGGYDVEHYRLDVHYDPASNRLDGHAVITAKATEDLARFDLDFGDLAISAITVNGAKAGSRRAGDTELVVQPARTITTGSPLTVDVTYGGKPTGTGFHTTYNGAFTFGEPKSATAWFPSNDHPQDKATYDIAITVPASLNAISNGVLQGQSTSDGWTTWRWHEGAPMATYLATMVVGRYRISTGTAAGVPMYNAVGTKYPPSGADALLAQTGPIIEYLATVFGPYPFDAVGGVAVDAPKVDGALETQTRPLYAPQLIGTGAGVLAHELAHQWFGDSVSVHDWRDIWLNEGFATYAQWLWSEHTGQATAQALFDRTYEDPLPDMWTVPPADPGRPNLFSRSVYQRGAMTLHELRRAVGDAAFFAILRGWAAEKRYGNGSTAEFTAFAEKISGKSLSNLFHPWLYGKTRPPA